jgi:Domain of unknown function (DUF4336)
MLHSLTDNLWTMEYPVKFYGLPLTTRMTVIRLSSGQVVIISPVPISASVQPQINAIGPVKIIIAPNLYHHLFVQDALTIYPEAEFWAVEGLATKRPDLKSDRDLTEIEGHLEDLYYREFKSFRVLEPRGNCALNEYVFFHSSSRTLILTDSAFHFDAQSSPLLQTLARLIGFYDKLQASVLEKWALRDRQAAKATIEKILSWDFDRVIVAHGSVVESKAKVQLKAGYEWLLGEEL